MNTCKFMCHSGLICSLCQRARSQTVSGTDSSTGSWSSPSFSLQSTGTSGQSNTWRTISSIKKYAIRWFVSTLEQSLGSSLRLTCIDSFKIFIYTFSLSFLLSTFLFLPGPVQATNTCTVQGETGARVGQGESELHFVSQQGMRPADETCQTLRDCNHNRDTLFKEKAWKIFYTFSKNQVKLNAWEGAA